MHSWFQNLNDDGRHLIHFRGSVGSNWDRTWFRYELSSGPALALKLTHGETLNDHEATQIRLGLFFFSVWLTFRLPKKFYFKKKCIATWDNNREFYLTEGRDYGFYFHDWAFVWSFHAKVMESCSSDPWWMRAYIHLDELVFGKWERLEDKLVSTENVFFKIGDKEFKMDSIHWYRNRRFRRFIPYSLYHSTYYKVEMKIDKPPMRAGKGENSWDCGDDGTYGMTGLWQHEIPSYLNREDCTKKAIQIYIENVMADAKRYGGGDGERGIRANLPYEYIGRKNLGDQTAEQSGQELDELA